jgi:hypothetical protein
MTKTFRIWAFGFRYCLVFSVSARDELGRVDLGFNPCLTATLYNFALRARFSGFPGIPNFDELVKSQKWDGKVKSSKCKDCES